MISNNAQIGTIRPEIADVIAQAIDNHVSKFHQGLPARVVKFHGESRLDVQPLLNIAYKTPAGVFVEMNMPLLQNIPMLYPAGGGYVIKFPMKPGDIVFLTFADRSMDNWLAAPVGTATLPGDVRKFDLNDAVATPGLRQFADAIKVPIDSLYLGKEDESSGIEITAADEIFINGIEKVEVTTKTFELTSTQVTNLSVGSEAEVSEVKITPTQIQLGTEVQPTILGDDFLAKFNTFVSTVTSAATGVIPDGLPAVPGGPPGGTSAAEFAKAIAQALTSLDQALQTVLTKRVTVE